MELFADVFNAMKAELKAKYRGCTFELARATATHTAWRVEDQSSRFIVVRESDGRIHYEPIYDWFRE